MEADIRRKKLVEACLKLISKDNVPLRVPRLVAKVFSPLISDFLVILNLAVSFELNKPTFEGILEEPLLLTAITVSKFLVENIQLLLEAFNVTEDVYSF